jgi:hypothetical protein
VVIYEDEMPEGSLAYLSLNLLTTQTMVTMEILPQGKIPMVEPGIEPGTS